MMKRLVSAAALSLMFAGTAFAQAPAPTADTPASATSETGSIRQPAEATAGAAGNVAIAPTESAAPVATTAAAPVSIETCIAAAADLGSTAENKSLTAESADRLDALFSKMETLCDGEKFAEAQNVADDIRTIISAN